MARETPSNARLRTGRSAASLDPNRSTVRRSSPRRNARASENERVSVPSPRNSRVSKPAPSMPKGPPLTQRAWASLMATSERVVGGLQARARQLLDMQMPSPSTWVLRTVGLLAIVAAALGVAHFVKRHLTTAPAFAIDNIEVKGLARIQKDELLAAAALAPGQNIFAQSPEQLQGKLAQHPWIVSASVARELPSKIAITVRERDPVALMVVEACAPSKSEDDPGCDEASSLYLISEDATMFKRLGGADPVDLPVITGLTRPRMATEPELAQRVLETSITLMRAYRDSGLWQQLPLGELHLEANDGLALYVGEDLTYVRLGSAPYDAKLKRLKKVFERLSAENARAEYVYLDNEARPDRVAVKLR
ncbi:MAG TPA: FtsQ-type POTRA domain-containing protein [Polyangiales bacterium]|nr:FtsQ-type POTRA domain-containing protein [Polyangiales bacterium]